MEQVELSHGVRIVLVPGITKVVKEGMMKVGSTHNVCPLPIGVVPAAPNLFEPLATDQKAQEAWVRHPMRSIGFAAQVRARVAVCHLSSVSFFWSIPARKLKKYLRENPNAGRDGDPKDAALVAKAPEKLRKRMQLFWAQTQASGPEVFDSTAVKGVKLSFEIRAKFEELPLAADYADFGARSGNGFGTQVAGEAGRRAPIERERRGFAGCGAGVLTRLTPAQNFCDPAPMRARQGN